MSVITISRGSFIGGKQVAERLAEDLGYRCIDREIIIARAAAGGISHEELHEALLEPPSLFDRIVTHRKHFYLTLLQEALAEEIQDGYVVYHGYVGHLLLAEAGPIFRIRIIASEQFRLHMVQSHLELSREEAKTYIEKVDKQRRKWTQALYAVNWEDPSLYDLVLNLGHIFDVEAASDILFSMIRKHKCFEFTADHQAALRDFALASRVRSALAREAPSVHLREVKASRGKVVISLVTDEMEPIQLVDQVANKVDGVGEVELKY